MILRRTYKILGNLFYTKDYSVIIGKQPPNQMKILSAMEEYSPAIQLNIGNQCVNTFFYSDKKIFAETTLKDDIALVNYFLDKNIQQLEDNELFLEILDKAANKILSTIKYLFDFHELDEDLFQIEKTLLFINNEWKECTDRRKTEWHYANMFFSIDNNTLPTIKKIFDDGIEPFLALKFLHRAKNEISLRDKWLFAAIAAELAVKEFLFKKDPKKNKKLVDQPMALEDLFGTFLTPFLRKPLPTKKVLLDNAKIRNEIIHRPFDRHGLTYTECIKYLDAVEKTIFFLLNELNPQNQFIEDQFKKISNDKRV